MSGNATQYGKFMFIGKLAKRYVCEQERLILTRIMKIL